MRRREFLATASAAAALMSSKPIQASQATDEHRGEDLSTESGSTQAAARILRVTNPGAMKGEMLFRELGAPANMCP